MFSPGRPDFLPGSPHIAVLMLTMFEDGDSVFAAIRAGARGYLLKGALKAEILIFSKLQVTDRAQAIIRAREAGLGT